MKCSDCLKLEELDDVVKNREYYDCDDIALTIHDTTLKKRKIKKGFLCFKI